MAQRNTMKTRPYPFFIGLLAVLLTLFQAGANGPLTATPPAPPFPAWEAAKLGDAYVAKTFPKFPNLYCSEVSYDGDDHMKPDPTVVWRLRYLLPNNPHRAIPGSPFPDTGVCLVFVHRDKSVTHTKEPTQNPPK